MDMNLNHKLAATTTEQLEHDSNCHMNTLPSSSIMEATNGHSAPDAKPLGPMGESQL